MAQNQPSLKLPKSFVGECGVGHRGSRSGADKNGALPSEERMPRGHWTNTRQAEGAPTHPPPEPATTRTISPRKGTGVFTDKQNRSRAKLSCMPNEHVSATPWLCPRPHYPRLRTPEQAE